MKHGGIKHGEIKISCNDKKIYQLHKTDITPYIEEANLTDIQTQVLMARHGDLTNISPIPLATFDQIAEALGLKKFTIDESYRQAVKGLKQVKLAHTLANYGIKFLE